MNWDISSRPLVANDLAMFTIKGSNQVVRYAMLTYPTRSEIALNSYSALLVLICFIYGFLINLWILVFDEIAQLLIADVNSSNVTP